MPGETGHPAVWPPFRLMVSGTAFRVALNAVAASGSRKGYTCREGRFLALQPFTV